MMMILIKSFNIIVKMAESIVLVQDAIITMYLPDSDENKQHQLEKYNTKVK